MRQPQIVPKQYANKWIAWTPDGLHILGAGDTPDDARRAAEARGPHPAAWLPHTGVAYESVPPADQRFIGQQA
jgi:hypothetical protein